jgi:2-keto-4-pentenoate hydratase
MTTHDARVEEAAARLRGALETGKPCPPVRDLLPERDLQAAYAVQETNTAYWIREGRRPVGRKIGLTALSVQRQLGVDQPDFGMLYADMALGDGEEIALSRVMQPKIEGEIAFVLEHDLTLEQATPADLTRAIAYVVPAIEVVGSRIANWDIKIVDTIADNASSGLFVLGGPPRKLEGLDLRLCGMVIEKGGEPVSVGAGAACLGHPLNAAVWLARKMVEIGRPLLAGDIIMSGALGPMAPVAPGDVAELRISGLGSAHAVFAKA